MPSLILTEHNAVLNDCKTHLYFITKRVWATLKYKIIADILVLF